MSRKLPRPRFLSALKRGLKRSQITALLGPRQSGKSTLARAIAASEEAEYFDLEDPSSLTRLENPKLALEGLKGLVVIDEIQLRPDLFPLLRVLADRDPSPARFLILGSASPNLIQNVAESLAGRVEFVELGPFDIAEVGAPEWGRLWIRGGLPRSFLSASEEDSYDWRENFVQTFLERDLPQLGLRIPSVALRRFWTMLAHCHGQIWNASEIGCSLGQSDKTVRRYLDILTGAFLIRQLAPWYENVAKREIKSPKVYFRDTGLLHLLLDLKDHRAVSSHPRCGASWEGFALEQVLRLSGVKHPYFWGTQGGAELDLMVVLGSERYGFEFKYADAPRTSRSMHAAIDALDLKHLWIIYPGKDVFPLQERISAAGIVAVEDVLRGIGEGRKEENPPGV